MRHSQSLCLWSALLGTQGCRAFVTPGYRTLRVASRASRSVRFGHATIATRLNVGQIVCVGEVLYDCIASEKARGWSADELVESGEWKAYPGGANANVATAFCKLSGDASFIGCVGTDQDGSQLTQLLQETGVTVDQVQTYADQPTRRIMVTRSMDGDREFGGFWGNRKADQFADAFLRKEKVLRISDLRTEADWIVCGTLSLAFDQTAATVEALVQEGRTTKLFVDVNWRPVIWNDTVWTESEIREKILDFIRRHKAEAVKLTDEEAEWLLGIPAAQAFDDPSVVHSHFPDAQVVLLTAGEKGASYSIFQCTGHVPPYTVNVTETTGAGDAFSAGFLYAWIRDDIRPNASSDAAERVVQFASAVGALACTREGAIAAQPTLAEVERLLSKSV